MQVGVANLIFFSLFTRIIPSCPPPIPELSNLQLEDAQVLQALVVLGLAPLQRRGVNLNAPLEGLHLLVLLGQPRVEDLLVGEALLYV